MRIRQFKEPDFPQIISLLQSVNIEPPAERSDFNGLCVIAEDEKKIVGCIWALVGPSSQAYIDYFAVAPEYEDKNIGWFLVQTIDKALKTLGVKRYTFYVEKASVRFIELLDKYGKANNVTKLRELQFYRREIGD